MAGFCEDSEVLDYSFSGDKYRVYMTVVEEVGEDEDMIESKVQLTVDILKVKDQEKWVVEFTRKEGDMLVFNSIFKDIKDYCGALNNATQAE